MNNNILEWIQEWYSSECDGDWEHTYGIKIETLDNPGWVVNIQLHETEYEDIELDSGLIENSEHDWYSFRIENSVFNAAGDLSKLEFLLKKFREIIESVKYPN